MLLHLRRRLAQDMFAFGDGAALNVAKHGWLIDDPALCEPILPKGIPGRLTHRMHPPPREDESATVGQPSYLPERFGSYAITSSEWRSSQSVLT